MGLARTLARPRMDQMSASVSANVNTSAPGGPQWVGDGGNPKLRPWIADSLDLSYEKYFGNKAYVGAAAFYKDLKSYIYKFENTHFDFSGFHNSSNVSPISNFGTFNQFQNGSGGKLNGVELSASLPLDLFTKSLHGFGLVGNYNITNSSIKAFGAGDTRTLPGLSKFTSNFTAYYEANGFSVRVARRYRSDFLGEITGFASNRYFQYIKAEAVTDLQLGYEFQSGYAKGLSLLLQLNNLTDAKYQEYQNTPDNITNSTKYGKTAYAGLTYKF
jgi:iron complex outermembrane receptor protein